MAKTSLDLPENLLDGVNRVATQLDRSRAYVIRKALEDYLTRHHPPSGARERASRRPQPEKEIADAV